MNKMIIAAAVAAFGVSTPALAQDDATFTGPYVAGIAGYDNLDLGISGVDNPDGVLYGVNFGYDIQQSGAILGIEGEYSDSTSSLSLPGPNLETDRDLYVGARVGAVTGNFLLYGKVGYTNARLEIGNDGSNGDGVRVGGGAEFKMGGNLFAKVEYRYSNYEAGVSRHQVVGGVGLRF